MKDKRYLTHPVCGGWLVETGPWSSEHSDAVPVKSTISHFLPQASPSYSFLILVTAFPFLFNHVPPRYAVLRLQTLG